MIRALPPLAACAALVLLGACAVPPEADGAADAPAAPDALAPAPVSAESAAFARYYRSVEARLVTDGLLRTDGGQTDAPVSAARLAASFERIALYDEYALSGGRFVQRQTPSRLRRWEVPVRIEAHFGASVSPQQRAKDRAILSTFASRLARATGHPISTVRSGGNFHVLFVNRDAQKRAGDLVRTLVPGVGDTTLREIETLPKSTFCSVYAFSETGGRPVYVAAVAIIRDEHPDLLRRACIHEEIAQGLGLPNDSPEVRPSIFNDDEEFALLTPHDEMLLRILYDPRLSPGLEPDDARATVRRISSEILGETG